jgi:hypothetical protein
MTRDQLLNLLRAILGSHEREMVCSDFFDQIPDYVDRVLAHSDPSHAQSEPPDRALPDVAHHLEQCPECREAYALLLELVRSDS